MTTTAYYLPTSVEQAVGLLAQHGASLLVMAGGTIAMPLINEGISFPDQVMGLRRSGVGYVRSAIGAVVLGATATLSSLAMGGARDVHIPLLQEAAHHVGGWAIRNMGTVGGNLFAPPPSGDFAVALLALDARVRLVSARGERVLPLADFYTGFLTTALQPDELLAEIHVPKSAGRTAYLKFGRRQANTPSVVTVAAHVVFDGAKVKQAALALNGVGDHPLRSPRAEASLVGSPLTEETIARAGALAAEDCDPATDGLASAWYRRTMVPVIVGRTLRQLVS